MHVYMKDLPQPFYSRMVTGNRSSWLAWWDEWVSV